MDKTSSAPASKDVAPIHIHVSDDNGHGAPDHGNGGNGNGEGGDIERRLTHLEFQVKQIPTRDEMQSVVREEIKGVRGEMQDSRKEMQGEMQDFKKDICEIFEKGMEKQMELIEKHYPTKAWILGSFMSTIATLIFAAWVVFNIVRWMTA